MDEIRYDYNQSAKKYPKDRLAYGDRCLLALHEGEIVGYVWITKDYLELSPGNLLLLPKNKVYLYKCFVVKKYRGKRIEGAMYSYLTDLLKREGKRFIVITIDATNRLALKTKQNDEQKIVGYLINLRFFGLRFDYIKNKSMD